MSSLRLSTWRAKSVARAPFGVERLLGGRLLLLPFVDQARSCVAARGQAYRESRASRSCSAAISLRSVSEIGEIAGQRVGLRAHVGNDRTEHNRGAHRLQRIFGLDQQRRRRLTADALQRGKDFDDRGLPLVERFTQCGLPLVERLEPRLGGGDVSLHVAHARRGIDELLIERAPIVAERVDLAPKLGLAFRRRALLRSRTASSS